MTRILATWGQYRTIHVSSLTVHEKFASFQADWMCCLANTSDGSIHANKSLICVPMDTPGVTIAKKIDKLGMWSSDTVQVGRRVLVCFTFAFLLPAPTSIPQLSFELRLKLKYLTFYSPSCLGQETAKGPFGRAKLSPVYHTRQRLHSVHFSVERQTGKL